MRNQNKIKKPPQRALVFTLSMLTAVALAACASPAGIHGRQQLTAPQALSSAESLPNEGGQWPASDWADRFGDAQLHALIQDALRGSPALAEATARLDAASALDEEAEAAKSPQVDANASSVREEFTRNALVPPPYGGSWQTEHRAAVQARLTLDLWHRLREQELSTLSGIQARRAEAEMVKLTLTGAITHAYTELARLCALRDIAVRRAVLTEQTEQITGKRFGAGLDTAVDRETTQGRSASRRSEVMALDSRIRSTQFQLAELAGAGPDRGLRIVRPDLSEGAVAVSLPDSLPADLIARRPDLVAARWAVDANAHEVKVARADFYPDINLAGAIGLDSFGFGRFLDKRSRTVAVGPALHLPLFDTGALRAQLKDRHAGVDLAIAHYNRTLVESLGQVATDVARLRASEAQLGQTRLAVEAARRTHGLAQVRYQAGLAPRLAVLRAELDTLADEQALTELSMARRDQAIDLALALGGGYQASLPDTRSAADPADSADSVASR